MSSKSGRLYGRIGARRAFAGVLVGWLVAGGAAAGTTRDYWQGLSAERFWEVVRVDGDVLLGLHGAAESRLGMFACRDRLCAPIPWQLDERDAAGRLALDQGPEPNLDDPPLTLDENDAVLFMAGDAGARAHGDEALPAAWPALIESVEIEVRDPRSARRVWAYLARFADTAPRSPSGYVAYDPDSDRIIGARVALGFENGTPRFLGLVDGDGGPTKNLLDRMKVRASARFLWGLFAVERSEDDVQTEFVAWRQGAIRVVRRQKLWVRLGWGIRTPIFGSDTYFYRDFAELPVSLRLNFAPHLLFSDIAIRAVLDFENLGGWSVETPGPNGGVRLTQIDGRMTAGKFVLARQPGEWFALHGPEATLVQVLAVSPSLRTVRRRLFYRESRDGADPPESQPGEMPGIGYTLTDWDRVSSGQHSFVSNSYALPRDQSVAEFMATLEQPLQISARLRAADEWAPRSTEETSK